MPEAADVLLAILLGAAILKDIEQLIHSGGLAGFLSLLQKLRVAEVRKLTR